MVDVVRYVLLVAHGSRLEDSNDEVRRIADELAEALNPADLKVLCAFLELAEPSIPHGIQQCIDHGATRVLVLPYFLAAGRHVSEDIPGFVEAKVLEYPDVDITLLPHIGLADSMVEILKGALEGFIRG